MATVRIISFDGGGVRGALSAMLVLRLAKQFPSLLDKVDLLAGTSTGAMMTLGLASGKTPAEMVEVYSQENMKSVFSPARLGFLRPKYDNKNLITLLHRYFQEDLKMKDLGKVAMVTAFQLDDKDDKDWSPVFFHNYPPREEITVRSGWNDFVVDVALRSSACPTIFPSYQGYIDGGVMANNPGTAAISVALGQQPGHLKLSDIRLLSIGTGLIPTLIKDDTSGWGVFQWMFNPRPPNAALLQILLDGVSEADSVMCDQMLQRNYCRLNPRLPGQIAIDNWRIVPMLVKIAQDFNLDPTLDWLREHWT